MAYFSQDELQAFNTAVKPTKQATVVPKKKGPSGLEGVLVNNLPAITGGLGAIAGTFAGPGAGTLAGGAAGGALGESIKRKLLGEKQDLGQIGIQAVEGGLLSGAGGALRGAKAAKAAVTGAEAAGEQVAKKGGSSFAEKLVNQGRSAQGRVLGVSPGSKVAGKELDALDQARMLEVAKQHNISLGNANNANKDIAERLNLYGKQIGDHFKTNNAPLKPEDTRVIADNFMKKVTASETDPRVIKEYQIVADNLKKNVKDTRGLWDFRKQLDSKIPDTKQGATMATTNKISAIKDMRRYIADELGQVPGMKEYRDLAEIKPFVSAEARRLNNPGGGIIGRLAASGPVQKLESSVGRGTEALGKVAGGEAVTTTAPEAGGFLSQFTKGNVIKNVGRQEVGRGFGIPAALSEQAQTEQNANIPADQVDTSQGLLDNSADVLGSTQQDTTNDPFAPENVSANVQAILAQGGKMKDVAEYLSNVKAIQDLTAGQSSTAKPISATAADAIANAQAGLTSLDQIEAELSKNPGVQGKEAVTQTFNPFGITGKLTGTSNYDTAITQAKDVIARLRTGAAISNSEEARFTKMLPQPADPPDTVKQKITLLRNALNTVVNRVGGNSADILQEAAANQ